MFYLRRAASRLAASSPTSQVLAIKPRQFASPKSLNLFTPAPSALLRSQRRFASDDAFGKQSEQHNISTEKIERSSSSSATEPMSEDQYAAENSDLAGDNLESAGISRRVTPSSPAPVPSNVLYVGNLFFDVTNEDLTREFSKYGDVLQARIISDPRGLSRGFGYVTLGTVEQATAASQSLNQQLFEGRRMTVQFKRPSNRPAAQDSSLFKPRRASGSSAPSRTLFIGNMSFEMTDQDLNELFREVRNVIDVRVAIDRRTGQPRGFAHADFIDIPSAEKAKEFLESKEVYGRRLRVDFSYSSRNSSPERGQGSSQQ